MFIPPALGNSCPASPRGEALFRCARPSGVPKLNALPKVPWLLSLEENTGLLTSVLLLQYHTETKYTVKISCYYGNPWEKQRYLFPCEG